MPQKTDDIGTSNVNNSMTNGKIFNATVDSPEPIENRQQSKAITDPTISRRLSTTIDRTAGMVGRSNPRQKNATISKVDDPVGNFRLSIDESVVSALLDCAYADVKHEVLGYLGGTCDVDRSDNTIVCRVGQFIASERIVTSLLTDEVQEIPNSREDAIKFFEENNLEFIGWYRSNFQSNLNSIPTQSDILKQTSIQSKTVLRETRQTYAGQVLECENRNGQRIFVDSHYESFLMNFLRKSALQFDRSIDQDFRTLSLAKLHVKSLISKRINDTLTISQNDKVTNDSEKLSKRRKLDKLIEKLVTQRMDKREKEMEKLKNGEKDTVPLFNPKSQNDEQSTNGPTVTSSTSEPLSKEPADTLESSISEHSNQKRKGSSSLSQPNNMNIDVVVIDSDSNSEIDVEETDDIPSKPLLRKPSLDSSQLNPISKRPKPSKFSSNHVQVNGNSSSIQSNKSPHLPSSFLPESPTFSPSPLVPNSSTIHIAVPNNSSTGTPNGSQFSQVNYQYPKYVTNGFRPFHNGPEDLNLRSPTSPNGNKIVNVSQSSGIHLPSIQGLLEISTLASMQPPPNPLPNVVVVDPNSTIVQHSSFPTPPILPSFQNNHYYSYNQQQAITRTTSPPDSSPIQHHLHTINNTSTGSTSTNSRHYVPIAPSPIATTTGGNRPTPPPPILQTSTSTSSSIYTNNTTNHFGAESDFQWKL
ncbi:unnamed protein product [Rhizophagus irregularis]|nr:unnamed protein product [Rhizophagus irregularis]